MFKTGVTVMQLGSLALVLTVALELLRMIALWIVPDSRRNVPDCTSISGVVRSPVCRSVAAELLRVTESTATLAARVTV